MLGEWSDPARVAEYLSRETSHRDITEGLPPDVPRMVLLLLPSPADAP